MSGFFRSNFLIFTDLYSLSFLHPIRCLFLPSAKTISLSVISNLRFRFYANAFDISPYSMAMFQHIWVCNTW